VFNLGRRLYSALASSRSGTAPADIQRRWLRRRAKEFRSFTERIRSFTIVTTTSNELCAELHNRMPVVLQPDVWPLWLGGRLADVPELKALLAPCPSDEMICWPVSARVGNVKNNDPSLIEPIAGIV
jgi:putative SOS response-associated peptidase YedK